MNDDSINNTMNELVNCVVVNEWGVFEWDGIPTTLVTSLGDINGNSDTELLMDSFVIPIIGKRAAASNFNPSIWKGVIKLLKSSEDFSQFNVTNTATINIKDIDYTTLIEMSTKKCADYLKPHNRHLIQSDSSMKIDKITIRSRKNRRITNHSTAALTIEFDNGTSMQVWMINNKITRCDANNPAIIIKGNGSAVPDTEIWAESNMLHRVDAPALISNKIELWALHGKLHRKHARPAITVIDDECEITICARRGDWHSSKDAAVVVKHVDGRYGHIWCKNALIHYAGGGPAIEYPNGNKEWWLNGKLHRTDGPAVVSRAGTERWVYKGRVLSGPSELIEKVPYMSDEQQTILKLMFKEK